MLEEDAETDRARVAVGIPFQGLAVFVDGGVDFSPIGKLLSFFEQDRVDGPGCGGGDSAEEGFDRGIVVGEESARCELGNFFHLLCGEPVIGEGDFGVLIDSEIVEVQSPVRADDDKGAFDGIVGVINVGGAEHLHVFKAGFEGIEQGSEELGAAGLVDDVDHIDPFWGQEFGDAFGEVAGGEVEGDGEIVEGVSEDEIEQRDVFSGALVTDHGFDVVSRVEMVDVEVGVAGQAKGFEGGAGDVGIDFHDGDVGVGVNQGEVMGEDVSAASNCQCAKGFI